MSTAEAATGTGGANDSRIQRRAIVPVLSVVTALWLVAFLAAGLLMRNGSWPVTGFGMFRGKVEEVVKPHLRVETRNGRAVSLTHRDFGFRYDNPITVYLRNHVFYRKAGRFAGLRPGAEDELARLVAAWNRTHASDPAVAATLTLEIVALPPDDTPRVRRLTWREP